MRFKVILRVSNFIHVKEVKTSLQVKDGHFSAQGIFIMIYGRYNKD
jgi:hypothetical protein